MTRLACFVLVIVSLASSSATAQQGRGRGPQTPPNIAGEWTGTWSSYNPARATTPPKELCAKLTATIAQKGDVWEAVFEGDCGRPYKYTIKMEGRLRRRGAVQGHGRSRREGRRRLRLDRPRDDNEFVGFFTSAAYTGVFSLARAK